MGGEWVCVWAFEPWSGKFSAGVVRDIDQSTVDWLRVNQALLLDTEHMVSYHILHEDGTWTYRLAHKNLLFAWPTSWPPSTSTNP